MQRQSLYVWNGMQPLIEDLSLDVCKHIGIITSFVWITSLSLSVLYCAQQEINCNVQSARHYKYCMCFQSGQIPVYSTRRVSKGSFYKEIFTTRCSNKCEFVFFISQLCRQCIIDFGKRPPDFLDTICFGFTGRQSLNTAALISREFDIISKVSRANYCQRVLFRQWVFTIYHALSRQIWDNQCY